MWKQLPVPTPAMMEPHLPFLVPRVLELVYTAYDMTPLARDLGDEGEPFRWDEDRRALLRAELDAFFFRMYGIDDRDDVEYILETFQTETGGLKHNDIAKYGTYRTKDLVLDAYDRMAAADATGVPYTTTIMPPPGKGPRHPQKVGRLALLTAGLALELVAGQLRPTARKHDRPARQGDHVCGGRGQRTAVGVSPALGALLRAEQPTSADGSASPILAGRLRRGLPARS